jgi:hypothetical protein
MLSTRAYFRRFFEHWFFDTQSKSLRDRSTSVQSKPTPTVLTIRPGGTQREDLQGGVSTLYGIHRRWNWKKCLGCGTKGSHSRCLVRYNHGRALTKGSARRPESSINESTHKFLKSNIRVPGSSCIVCDVITQRSFHRINNSD